MTDGAASLEGARARRAAAFVFLTLFGTYAYFFQGGGWNQNSRIAQVRSTVEGGTLAIDDYLFYKRVRPRTLVREPRDPGVAWEKVADRASSADVTFSPNGRIYPNKPPGTLLVAAPVYAAVLAVERWLGVNADEWRVLTFNSHVLTALSAGLAGALIGVLLLRLSRALFGALPLAAHVAAALTCGLGTLVLPYSTVMFDHTLAAFWPLLSFAALVVEPQRPSRAFVAGAAAGMGVMTSYTCAAAAGLLLLYLLALGRRSDAARFVAGLLPPLALLGAYQAACFGSPLVLANSYQYRSFMTEGRLLGVLSWPDPDVLSRLLVSPQRGLFVTSPVLLLAALGLVSAWRGGRRAEVSVAVGFFGALWLFNGAFNGWHGGWAFGPRYLLPAIPFIALFLAPAFGRLPRLAGALALLSVALMALATAVDVQPPRRARDPLPQYLWPLWQGKTIGLYEHVNLRGPVSVNPIGVYEGTYYTLFTADSRVSRWNSYNLGELLWPASRLSLLPLALWLGLGSTLAFAAAARRGQPERRPPPQRE